MQVHDRLRLRAFRVHREVKPDLLRRCVAIDVASVAIQSRETCRVERPEGRTRRRHKPATVGAHTDVPGRAGRKALSEQRPPMSDDRVPQLPFVHCAISNACRKKSGPPKFPDLSATASGGSPSDIIHGTPGAISLPTASVRIPSALTMAADVSPPAKTSRRAPLATRRRVSSP